MAATTLAKVIQERLASVQRIKAGLPSQLPKKMRRGSFQDTVLDNLGLTRTGRNRRLVSEAMVSLGYRMITVRGNKYYGK